jgi:hypothetical protein
VTPVISNPLSDELVLERGSRFHGGRK